MDDMTNGDRESFIDRRIREIVDAYKTTAINIANMTERQRDDFVHRRVERDLAIGDSINREQASIVALRTVTGNFIIVLDVIALAGLFGIMLREWRDVLPIAIVAAVFTVSSFTSWWMLKKSNAVLDMMYSHASRTANTATLDFLVDEIHDDPVG